MHQEIWVSKGLALAFDLLAGLAKESPSPAVTRIALQGLGGAGKTTLASRVARDPAVRQCFDRVCWLTVGHTPDVPMLQQSLLVQLMDPKEALGKEEAAGSAAAADPQAMLERMRKAVRGQPRVIVFLDDLWEGQEKLLGFSQ